MKIEECNQDIAIQLADKEMKKNGYEINKLKRTVINNENDDIYEIHYAIVSKEELGGGGEISISRTTCKIINKVFYQ